MVSLSFVLVLAALSSAQPAAAKKVLGTKVRSRNKTYKVEDSTDLEMCKAVVREMHTELIKHNMKEAGEDNIFDTAGMAICLGVVQNYTFAKVEGKKSWKLLRKEGNDNEALESFVGGGGDMGQSEELVEGLLLTKTACMIFCEELQMEISEVMYSRVHEATGDKIADEFCPQAVRPVKERVQKYVPLPTSREKAKKDPMASMQDLLDKRDPGGAISEMLEQEAFYPEQMLDPPLPEEVKRATADLTCQVCKAAVRQAHAKVKEVEKTPAFKDKWQRQALVAEVVNPICHGKDKLRLEQGYYPTVPGNPPEWGEDYYIVKKDAQYSLKKGPQTVARMKEVVGGNAGSSEGEGEWEKSRDKHSYDVMRRAIVRNACKIAIDQRLDTEEGDLSELLLEARGEDPKVVAKSYCAPFCKAKGTSDEL